MKNINARLMFLFLVILLGNTPSGYASRSINYSLPQIPMEQIPAGIPEDVKAEIEKLYSSDHKVRHYAAGRLGSMGERAHPAIPFLIETLADNWVDRVPTGLLEVGVGGRGHIIVDIAAPGLEAYNALMKFGASAVDHLMRGLRNDRKSIRKHCALILGKMRDARAVDTLVAALKDEAKDVRRSVVVALAQIEDPQAVVGLIAALTDTDDRVKKKSQELLVKIANGESIESPYLHPRKAFRQPGDLVKNSTEVVGPLIDALEHKNSQVRMNAASVLAEIGDARAVKPLITALNDQDFKVRREVADSLGEFGDPSAVPSLIRLVKVELRNSREKLSRSRDATRSSRSAMRKELQRSPSNSTNLRARSSSLRPYGPTRFKPPEGGTAVPEAMNALGKIGGDKAIKTLISLLNNEDCRRHAIKALGHTQDPNAVKLLSKVSRRNSLQAASALAKMGTEQASNTAIDILRRDLKHKNSHRKREAVKILASVHTTGAIRELLRALHDPDISKDVESTFGRLERARDIDYTGDIGPLLTALGHNSDAARRFAVKKLKGRKDPRAVQPLIGALRDNLLLVRGFAAYCLGDLEDTSAVGPLIDSLDDEEKSVRNSAKKALQKITSQDFGYDANNWRTWWQKNK